MVWRARWCSMRSGWCTSRSWEKPLSRGRRMPARTGSVSTSWPSYWTPCRRSDKHIHTFPHFSAALSQWVLHCTTPVVHPRSDCAHHTTHNFTFLRSCLTGNTSLNSIGLSLSYGSSCKLRFWGKADKEKFKCESFIWCHASSDVV